MIEYKKATIEDMGEVAQLHIACFPEYFLTKLDGGKGVLLKEFYKCALGDKKIFILAKDGRSANTLYDNATIFDIKHVANILMKFYRGIASQK